MPNSLSPIQSFTLNCAVGFTLRRLASKCADTFAVSKLASYITPHQMGAGVKGGCEGVVH